MTQELLALVTALGTEGSSVEIQTLAQAIVAMQPATPPTPPATS